MIAKLERTQSNAQQNKDKHRISTTNGKHTKQQINNNRTTALERLKVWQIHNSVQISSIFWLEMDENYGLPVKTYRTGKNTRIRYMQIFNSICIWGKWTHHLHLYVRYLEHW